MVNLSSSYRDANQSSHTGPTRFFPSSFGSCQTKPKSWPLVADNYYYDMAIHYMTLAGEGGPRRGIGRIEFDADGVRAAPRVANGRAHPRRIFAFAGGALFLATDGLLLERADALRGRPLTRVWVAAAGHDDDYSPAPTCPRRPI